MKEWSFLEERRMNNIPIHYLFEKFTFLADLYLFTTAICSETSYLF